MSSAVRISCEGRVGTGSVIAGRLLLTCEHVVRGHEQVDVRCSSGEVTRFRTLDSDAELDVALLEPCEPQFSLPAESVAIPRTLWRGAYPAVEETTVEVCTEEAQTSRSVPIELRVAHVGATRVPFGVRGSREGIRPGYSGGPVLQIASFSRTPRLLGIVRARDEHSVDELDSAGAGWLVPTELIAARFAEVASLVESPIERTASWEQHLEPKSRGVASSEDDGFFFSGRALAYKRVVEHLAHGSGLLVITGSRGHGKSALLARAIVLGCPRYLHLLGKRRREATGDYELPANAIDAAVVARAKTPVTLAGEIAQQLGSDACAPDALAALLKREALEPAIAIDAVDESADAGALMRELIAPLAEARARVAVGSLSQRLHRSDVPEDTIWVDLNTPEYDDDAIATYVRKRLLASGRYDESTASKVAAAAEERAAGNFLVAELIARTLAGRTALDTSAEGWQLSIADKVGAAFHTYLGRFGEQRERMLALLHPLAHARGEGLTIDPGAAWCTSANLLRADDLDPIEQADLRNAAQNAADYLIVSATDGARHLYHEGLADAVRALSAEQRLARTGQAVTEAAVEQGIRDADREFVEALMSLLPRNSDASAEEYLTLDPYLLGYLPTHLAEHGRTEELLDRPGLLLTANADVLRGALTAEANGVPSERESEVLALIHALGRPQESIGERAAAVGATLLRQGANTLASRIRKALGPAYTLPYELISGPSLPSFLGTIPAAHVGGCSALVTAVWKREPLIISAGFHGAIRSWQLDWSPGPLYLEEPSLGATSRLLMVEHEGEPLLIGCGVEKAIRSWRLDGRNGPLEVLGDSAGRTALATLVEHDQRWMIVVPRMDGSLHSWWLDGTRGPLSVEQPNRGELVCLAAAEHEGAQLIVCGGFEGELWSWWSDGTAGPLVNRTAHEDSVISLGVARLRDGRSLFVSASFDGALRSWWPDGRRGPLEIEGIDPLRRLEVLNHDDKPLVVGAGIGGSLNSWRLSGRSGPLSQDDAHESQIFALATVERDGHMPVIVTGAMDGAVRSWGVTDSATSRSRNTAVARSRSVGAMVAIQTEGKPLIVADTEGDLQSWWLNGDTGPVINAGEPCLGILELAVAEHEGAPLIVAAGTGEMERGDPFRDAVLRSWRLDGSRGPIQYRTHGRLGKLVVAEHEGKPLVIAAFIEDFDVSPRAGTMLRSWWCNGERGPLRRRISPNGRMAGIEIVKHGGQSLLVCLATDGALQSCTLEGEPVASVKGDSQRPEINCMTIAMTEREEPVVVGADREGALRSWTLDGHPGPLGQPKATRYRIDHLTAIECEGAPLIVGAGLGGISSWRIDGAPGPLAHGNTQIERIAVVRQDGTAVWLISSDTDGVLLAHQIPGTPPHP